jgi:hypothetical protein
MKRAAGLRSNARGSLCDAASAMQQVNNNEFKREEVVQ